MKFLLFLLSIFTFNTWADEAPSRTFRLICKVQYEILQESIRQERAFTMYGKQTPSGIKFEYKMNDIPAYAFDFDGNGLPEAFWHYDSRIEFSAILNGRGLIYNFSFYNYSDARILQSVFQEIREVELPMLMYYNEANFDYYLGQLIESEINLNSWVNERGVQVKNCSIDIY